MIIMASDHRGYMLKEQLKTFFNEENIITIDVGTYSKEPVDYPDFATLVCKEVANKENYFGILVCGSGIGMSICANKIHGIRCALVDRPEIAKLAREHNNANTLAIGACLVDFETCKKIVDIFLQTPFSTSERHHRRVDKIMALEGK